MPNTYNLAVRVTEMRTIASFELEDGEALEARVRLELAKANEQGLLGQVATRIMAPVVVTAVAAGENLTGGENVVSTDIFALDGTPLTDRTVQVAPLQDTFVAVGVDDGGAADGGEEKTLGVFPTEDLANDVGQIWRAGHLTA